MRYEYLLKLAVLVCISNYAYAAHVQDRVIYATDIVNASGTSVFKFPTSAPTASRAKWIEDHRNGV